MKHLIAIILVFTCTFSKAQVNLVLNPDFEQYSQCPTQSDQINFATYWSGIDSVGNIYCTPEYCNTCASFGVASVPASDHFFQYPRSGNGMAHLQVFKDNSSAYPYHRDYLLGRLQTQLINGKSYCVSFYVTFTEISQYYINKIGAYLDDGDICNVPSCTGPLTQFIPDVENNSGVIVDTVNWVKIEGTFVADGSERFITIGNFYDMANTDTIIGEGSFGYSWLLVDDVSVIESDLEAFAGPDTWIVEGDSVFIGRTPEVGLNCKWLVNGSVVDSGAGIWAKPAVTTTYVVEQIICGLTKTDTVIVEVWPVSVSGITNEQQLKLFPNPATNELLIQLDKPIFTSATVFNQLGQQVVSIPISSKETKVDIHSMVPGVYSIVLDGEGGQEVRRFVKM